MPTGSVYPYVIRDSTREAFKTVSIGSYSDYAYGDIITGSYPLTASISSEPYVYGQVRKRINALKNTLDHYRHISPHYAYSSSFGNKSTQALRLISIPSIFYGSQIKKGTISCKFYLTGTLIAELGDPHKNGTLVQTGPFGSAGSGSIAGVALYKEGFVILTGSWDLHDSYTDNFNIYEPASSSAPTWRDFFTTGSGITNVVPSSSFNFTFEGTQYIPTVTMLCHALRGEFNHSNNPTYITYGQDTKIPYSGSTTFRERDNVSIKNLIKVPYIEEDPPFEKVTYISKVSIYDEEGELIAIAKLATPVRKREIDSYTFKLKVDI